MRRRQLLFQEPGQAARALGTQWHILGDEAFQALVDGGAALTGLDRFIRPVDGPEFQDTLGVDGIRIAREGFDIGDR